MVRDLNPGVFAFVMATGIVSTDLRLDGQRMLSAGLLAVALAGYAVLVGLSGWRLARWPRHLLADASSPRGFALLTFVAASDVLAARLAEAGWRWPTAVLLAVAVLGWLVLGYGIPLGLVADSRRHPGLHQVNGTWFIWVVLYLLVAALALARLLVRPVAAGELRASCWVFMGAAAITVLAGAGLREVPAATRLVPPDVPSGVSVVLWAFGSWLVPLLVALGGWRHLVRGVSLRYDSSLWSMAFPIGMYGVASVELGRVIGARFLIALGGGVIWAAFAAWLALFVALIAAGVIAIFGQRGGVVPRSGCAARR